MIVAYVIFAFLAGAIFGNLTKTPEAPQELADIRKPNKQDRQKIFDLIDQKKQVANHDIQKALKVSASTAVRYMDRMQEAGMVEQHGDTGRSTYYTKK